MITSICNKLCNECQNTFSSNRHQQKYCSAKCRNKAGNRNRRKNKLLKFDRICPFCKDSFYTKTHNKAYCNRKCYDKAQMALKYKLSIEEYKFLQLKINCDICGIEVLNKQIDHCHDTGKVRGILCRSCNVGLGHFKDSPIYLKKAIDYLSGEKPRRDIVDCMKEAYKRGWITSRDGNISIRRDNKVYITRSGVNKSKLTFEDIDIINIVNNIPVLENKKPSIEFHMHWLILKKYGNVSVVHLHPPNSVGALEADENIVDICKNFPELSRYTKVGDSVPKIFPGERSLAEITFENISKGNSDIVILKGHGVTSIGANPWEAFEHIERLEHISQIVLASGKRP